MQLRGWLGACPPLGILGLCDRLCLLLCHSKRMCVGLGPVSACVVPATPFYLGQPLLFFLLPYQYHLCFLWNA